MLKQIANRYNVTKRLKILTSGLQLVIRMNISESVSGTKDFPMI